jgi:hypothetical protein
MLSTRETAERKGRGCMNEAVERERREDGHFVTTHEMYQIMQRILIEVEITKHKVDTLTELSEQLRVVLSETDERSRLALDVAQDSMEIGKKVDADIAWLWKTILGGLIVSMIGAFFVLAQKGMGG